VIVYCNDYQGDVSPRAASRLEAIGFPRVYDYVAGKKDWGSYGLPHKGTNVPERSAGDVAHRDVPQPRASTKAPSPVVHVGYKAFDRTLIAVNLRGTMPSMEDAATPA